MSCGEADIYSSLWLASTIPFPFRSALSLHCFPIDDDLWTMAHTSAWADLFLHGDTGPLPLLAHAVHHLESVCFVIVMGFQSFFSPLSDWLRSTDPSL